MKQHRRLIAAVLTVVLLLSMTALPASAAGTPFTDVPDNAWYKNAVTYAYENGLFSGTGATTFSPNAPMTRAMFVQVLSNKTSNYNKADWAGKSSFSDVKKDKWYAAAVEWATKAGLIVGMGDGKFAPEKNVTREQMALIMYNYAKKTGNDTSFDENVLSQFPDSGSVSRWAKEAMQWAVTHKVVNGSDGKLKPGSAAKRCEVAQVAVNADPILANTTVEVTPDTPTPDPDPNPAPGPDPDPKPNPDPDPDPGFVDPTPDDLPAGALTYQEFVDLFSDEIKTRPQHDTFVVFELYCDMRKMTYQEAKAVAQAIKATGKDTFSSYQKAHLLAVGSDYVSKPTACVEMIYFLKRSEYDYDYNYASLFETTYEKFDGTYDGINPITHWDTANWIDEIDDMIDKLFS